MNRKFTKLLSVFVIAGAIGAGAAFAATGCNKKDDDPGKQEQTDGVTSVTVKAAGEAKTVANGGTLQLSAEVVVTGSAAKTVTWSIKSGATATEANVSSTGLLSAGTVAGKVTVVATSTVDNTKKGELEITVQEAQKPAEPTVTGVTVTAAESATTMYTGKTLQLSVVVAGENSPSQDVTWEIDTAETTSTGASVSATGLLTAGTTAGKVVVKATSVEDNTKPALLLLRLKLKLP